MLQVNSELPQPEGSEQDAEDETHTDEAAQTDRQMAQGGTKAQKATAGRKGGKKSS